MDRLLDEIESYWSTRTEGYSEVNEKELKGMQKKAWLKTLESGFLEKKLSDNDKEQLRILDIGTGPGFFPMILAEAGYHVRLWITPLECWKRLLKMRQNLLEKRAAILNLRGWMPRPWSLRMRALM